MKRHLPLLLGCLMIGVLSAERAQAAAASTFVASNGIDSNTSANCARSAPCRTFAAALSVTAVGGELIVVDSEDYGPASIAQSVSIIAPEGVYAGIRSSGTGISISGSGQAVTLKGLTFESSGSLNSKAGSNAVVATGFTGAVTIQGCHFSGYSPSATGTGGIAIYVAGTSGPVQVHIVDSDIREGGTGVALVGSVAASIRHLRFSKLGYGVVVADNGYGEADVSASDIEWIGAPLSGGTAFVVTATSASAQLYLDRAVVTGGGNGVHAQSNGALAYVTVTNSVFSKVGTAMSTALTTASGAAQITVAGSMINANSCGMSSTSGGTLISAGNNLFVGNGSDVLGNLSRTSLQ